MNSKRSHRAILAATSLLGPLLGLLAATSANADSCTAINLCRTALNAPKGHDMNWTVTAHHGGDPARASYKVMVGSKVIAKKNFFGSTQGHSGRLKNGGAYVLVVKSREPFFQKVTVAGRLD